MLKTMGQRIFILTFLLIIIFCIGHAQEVTSYAGTYELGTNIESFVLIDTINETNFILDSTQIYVTAIDKNGNQLWQTDPWKDNNLIEYRVERPIIVRFYFVNNERTNNKEVIWIVYNNTQFGIIDKITGGFIFYGQD
jgi:hypothetical protein